MISSRLMPIKNLLVQYLSRCVALQRDTQRLRRRRWPLLHHIQWNVGRGRSAQLTALVSRSLYPNSPLKVNTIKTIKIWRQNKFKVRLATGQ